jgi:phosphate/sulfate permease
VATGIARRLKRLRHEAAREWRARLRAERRAAPGRRSAWRDVALFALTAAALGALPFVALIRGSLHLHQYRGWPASVALAAGALATAAIVALYGIWLVRRVTGRLHVGAVVRWFAVPVVAFYATYALVYVSSANLKHERLRAYYATLHPLLRVALATVILADEELVLTDLERRPEDYQAMGLAVNPATLHARQPDGWVHAVDLRTADRSAVRNRLVQWYFAGMGFATLRHRGTADHLHVAIR